ncbi:hypothetical protein AAMO2058_001074500 [Amorphochlora amoebiformis]
MISVKEQRQQVIDLLEALTEKANACPDSEELKIVEKKLSAIYTDFKKVIQSEKRKEELEKAKIEKSYDLDDNKATVNISITDIKEIRETFGKIYAYEVESYIGPKYGKTLVRFHHFKDLQKDVMNWLSAKGKQSLLENVPQLPATGIYIFSSLDSDKETVAQYSKDLEAFLVKIVTLPNALKCEAVRKFLDLGSA